MTKHIKPFARTALARLLAVLPFGLLASAAGAHFLVLHTPETALNRPQDLPLTMVFTHIYNAAPTMDLAKPQKFYFVHQQGRGMSEETDLSDYLKAVEWDDGQGGKADAWRAEIPRDTMRSLGDYQIVVEAEPYFEETEGLYIQQFTKIMVNVGGVPGNWASTLGLPAEIQALNKPYANWTDGVFRGVVLSDGIPVPFTQVEVSYLNHPPEPEAGRFQEEPIYEAPHPAFETMILLTNEWGEFSFSMPKEGWWGFAALSVGPDQEHEGEYLSQDAILWVQARDFPE